MPRKNQKRKWAARMRNNPTPSEALLRQHLPTSEWGCQIVKYGYILDFYNYQAKICVEVDGSSHNHRAEWDARRDTVLLQRGIKTVRFTNDEVNDDPAAVAARIAKIVALRLPEKPRQTKPPRMKRGSAANVRQLNKACEVLHRSLGDGWLSSQDGSLMCTGRSVDLLHPESGTGIILDHRKRIVQKDGELVLGISAGDILRTLTDVVTVVEAATTRNE